MNNDIFTCKWYFCNMLMSAYKGTQKEIEDQVKKAGEEYIFFGRHKWKKVNENRLESTDEIDSRIVIERAV